MRSTCDFPIWTNSERIIHIHINGNIVYVLFVADYVYMNINSVLEIKKPTNPPLLNIAGKMTTLLIFILLKLFGNPTQYLNLTSLKLSISIKIIIMLSTVVSSSLLYQIVGKFTLNLISPDSFLSFRLYKYLFIQFSNWSTPLISCNSIGSYSLHLDPLINYIKAEFSISLSTEDGMLNATETAVCNFSHFCALYVVHSTDIFSILKWNFAMHFWRL